MQHYVTIAKPLTHLLQKDSYQWSDTAEASFSALKHALMSIPMLDHPDFSRPFIVETDVCHSGMGVVLLLGKQFLGFLSKTLPPSMIGLYTYDKELWVSIFTVTK